MFKNVASQVYTVFAFDRTDNTPKTGDAANITCVLSIDGGALAALSDTNPTETNATTAKGYYTFTLTAAEANGDTLRFFPASSTSDIQVIGLPAVVETEPYAVSGTLPAYSGAGMTVSTARAWVRDALRDGGDSTIFSDATIDRAIQQAGNYYCRMTRSIKRTDSVTITEGSTSFPLTAPIAAGFRPERVIDVWITGQTTPLQLLDYAAVVALAADDDSSDVPAVLAFLDESGNGYLWPEPDDDYTAKLRYWLPFTTWTAGSDDSTTLNIPTDLIMPVLKDGAAGVALEANKETRAYAGLLWEKFKAYCVEMKGAGDLGARVTYRQKAATFASVPPVPEDRPAVE